MRQYTTAFVFGIFFVIAGLTSIIPFKLAEQAPPGIFQGAGLVVFMEILVLLVLCVLPVAWRCSQVGIKAFTEPLCLMSAAMILYYVVRGFVLLSRAYIDSYNRLLYVNPASHKDLAIAIGYALAGFCAFHIGYRFWNPPRLRESQVASRRGWSAARLNRVALVCIAIACFSTLMGIRAAGGIGGVLSNFGRLREVTAGYGYALLGTAYWVIMFAFLLRDRLQRHKNILIPLALLGIANIWDAFQGNRNGVLAAWITGIVLYLQYLSGRKSVRSAVILVCVMAAGLAFALPMARAREYTKTVSGAIQVARDYWTRDFQNIALMASEEFCALDSFSIILAIGPSEFPFRYGGTFLDGILFVIPRSVWPDKPRSFSFALGQYVHGVDTDIPPGFIGELYINFHVAGVVLGMYLLGLLLRKAHQLMLSDDSIGITVYSVLIPYIIAFMGRSFIGGGTLVLIPLGLLLPVVWYLRRKSAPDPELLGASARIPEFAPGSHLGWQPQ